MTTKTTVESLTRGDVVLVLFPNSDLRTAKLRPVIVVQANELGTGLPQIIVAMISSHTARVNHPSRILVTRENPGWKATGLLRDSVVMADNSATVHESALDRRIGTIDMTPIDAALR